MSSDVHDPASPATAGARDRSLPVGVDCERHDGNMCRYCTTPSVTVIRVQPGLEGIFGFLKREDVRDGIAGVGDGV